MVEGAHWQLFVIGEIHSGMLGLFQLCHPAHALCLLVWILPYFCLPTPPCRKAMPIREDQTGLCCHQGESQITSSTCLLQDCWSLLGSLRLSGSFPWGCFPWGATVVVDLRGMKDGRWNEGMGCS